MEENSEAQVENDVSSVAENSAVQLVEGSCDNIQTIVVVEEIKEEQSVTEHNGVVHKPPEPQAPDKPIANAGLVNEPVNPPMSNEKVPHSPVQNESPAKGLCPTPTKEGENKVVSPKEPQALRTYARSLFKDQLKVSQNTVSKSTESAVSPIKDNQSLQQTPEVSSKALSEVSGNATPEVSDIATPENEKLTVQEKEPSHSDSIKSPTETSDEVSINKKILDNPLLSDVLFGKSENTQGSNLETVQKPEETTPPTVTDSPDENLLENTNDTLETSSETSEIPNKNTSRELRSLIKYAKESKIISECTQLTSKTRKSRTALDSSSSSLTSSSLVGDGERPIGSRRNSDNSLMSSASEKSDKTIMKRSMRSQNPEFVNKVKLFLNSVTGKISKGPDAASDEEIEEKKTKDTSNDSQTISPISPKKKKSNDVELYPSKENKIRSDPYCWRCHWAVGQEANEKQHPPMLCTVCPRSFHYKCLSGTEKSKIVKEKSWVCPECLIILQAESSETRSPAMKRISLGCLSDLLKHALDRMMDLNGVEPFMMPVDRTTFPDYKNYVVHPMNLALMKENINNGLYGSTEAFLADAQWILHNSIIFNTCANVVSVQSKLTAAARALVRSCKAEMGEIEACPECYAAAHSRRPTWFTDVCTTPHLLLWAKLKGFPYWPAKCMTVNNSGLVDVRFFGAHDRAWVPARDCFLYSEKDPNNFRTKRQDILDSMQEAEHHIRNISRKYGKFVYPPFKTQLDTAKLTEQLKIMIPSFDGELKTTAKDKSTPKPVKNKSRSNSKSSKGSCNDGEHEHSDTEDTKSQPRKMADGAEIAMEEDFSINKDKTMEVDENPKEKTKEDVSRKRRRSQLEEAVITIMEGSSKEKKKCPDTTEDKPIGDIPEVATNEKPADKTEVDKTQSNAPQVNEVKMLSTLTPVSNKELSKSPEEPTRPPIKMILKTRPFKTSTPKAKGLGQGISSVIRAQKKEKRHSSDKEKEADKVKSRRRNSKNKSLNASANETTKADKNNDSNTITDLTESDLDVVNNDSTKADENLTESKVTESKDNGKPKEDTKEKKNDEKDKINDEITEEMEISQDVTAALSEEQTKSKNKTTISKSKDEEKLQKSNGNKNKDSPKGKGNYSKSKITEGNIQINDKTKRNSTSLKIVKDVNLLDEDNTSLAIIARENSKRGSLSGLPTITSVRSLSSPQTVQTSKTSKSVPNSDSIFTPTSTDSVRNMKDAVIKLNKLRSDTDQSLVGKVGVCAFARMPSTPPADKTNKNSDVQVEIKTEPMDFDDADRQAEKLNLMNAFRLQPVSTVAVTPPTTLREVRINKVVSAPVNVRKTNVTTVEVKSRPRKTFTQKKGEGSELNGKNSMVYIPIQPPVTQAPIRAANRPITINGNPQTISIARSVVSTPTSNSIVTLPPPNQVAIPPTHTSTAASSTMTMVSVTSSAGMVVQSFPTVGQVPTTVHKVPLITSVNGQWTFSLQPIMSVGGLDVDNDGPPPLINGIAEHNKAVPPALPPLVTTVSNPAPAFPTTPRPLPNLVANSATPSPSLLETPSVHNSPGSVLNRPSSEDTVGEPPRLQHKPLMNPFDVNTPLGSVPPPSTAGPITAKLNQNAIKLTDFFRTILEDTIEKIDEPAAQITGLKLQIEEARWRHKQEIDELKHNHDLLVAEMRASFEKERARIVDETRRAAQLDLEAAVKVAKSKQWCANCSQEAQFYCCWNTSYCDYGCQRAHWGQHYSVCTQQRTQENNTNTDSESANRLQPSENLPKTTAAPTLTKGKITRVINPDATGAQKGGSIIVSMVEDKSGNQTMKCVGTYKPNTAPQLMSPLILNKPVSVLSSEELAASKKVVTSGGYLIVGAPATAPNTASIVTPQRRPQTIQYFS